MATPKALNLYLYNGKASGCKRWDSPTMAACVHSVPRTARRQASDIEELSSSGIYALFGTELSGNRQEAIYIGQSKSLFHRVFQDDPVRGIDWTEALIITNGKKALEGHELNYLEHSLYHAAKAAGRFHVTNKQEPNQGTPNDILQAHMSDFLRQVHFILESFGITAFLAHETSYQEETPDEESVIFTYGDARGMRTADGFVVLKGSIIKPANPKKAGYKTVRNLRDNYAESISKDNRVCADLFFRSSTAAAMFVCGGNVSGPATWKTRDAEGKLITLKDFEKTESPRPPLHLQEMGIPLGAELTFRQSSGTKGDEISVTVQGPSTILHKGHIFHLYPLTEQLIGKHPDSHFLGYWHYGKKNLDTLYNQTYKD